MRDTLANPNMRVWVAHVGQPVVGFVAATLHPERLLDEIAMIAVDPDAQRRGVGSALTAHATDWLHQVGVQVAMMESGGDPAHTPARRLYEKANYTHLQVARYFKAL